MVQKQRFWLYFGRENRVFVYPECPGTAGTTPFKGLWINFTDEVKIFLIEGISTGM